VFLRLALGSSLAPLLRVTDLNQQLRDRVFAASGQPGHGADGLPLAKQVEDLGTPERYRSRVLTLFFRRRVAVGLLPRRNLDNRLGELVGVSRAFGGHFPNSSESKTNRALSPIIWAVSRELSKPITSAVSPSQTCHSHRSGLRGITLTSSRRGLLDILRICARACPFSSQELCHNQTDPLPKHVLIRKGVLAPFHRLTRRMAPFEKVKWPLLNLVDYRT
jgi:hypothetical protein